jgi:hypothetical protein
MIIGRDIPLVKGHQSFSVQQICFVPIYNIKTIEYLLFSKLCVWTLIVFYKSTSISSYYVQSLVVQSKSSWWRCNICNLPQPTSTSKGLHSYETSVGWFLEITPTNMWFLEPFFKINDHGSKTIKEPIFICNHGFPKFKNQ